MDQESTLKDLGLHFELVDPDVRLLDLSNYASNVRCARRREVVPHAFSVAFLVLECDQCSAETMLDLDDEANVCSSCGAVVRSPERDQYRQVYVCYEDFRDGYGAVVQDTEFGMLTPELAAQGRTHGIPRDLLEILPGAASLEWTVDDSDWAWPRIDAAGLELLTHTPSISSWQEPTWLFEDERPMTFLGYWEERHFEAAAPRLGEALFRGIVDEWAYESWGELGHRISVYMFRGESGRLRGVADMS